MSKKLTKEEKKLFDEITRNYTIQERNERRIKKRKEEPSNLLSVSSLPLPPSLMRPNFINRTRNYGRNQRHRYPIFRSQSSTPMSQTVILSTPNNSTANQTLLLSSQPFTTQYCNATFHQLGNLLNSTNTTNTNNK